MPMVIAVIFVSKVLLLPGGINISTIKRPVLTEEEVKASIQISWDDGAITTSEKNYLSRIFSLNDRSVRQVIVPEAKMTTINVDWSKDKILKTINKSGYSRFPVVEAKSPEVIGFVLAKDVLGIASTKKRFFLKKSYDHLTLLSMIKR